MLSIRRLAIVLTWTLLAGCSGGSNIADGSSDTLADTTSTGDTAADSTDSPFADAADAAGDAIDATDATDAIAMDTVDAIASDVFDAMSDAPRDVTASDACTPLASNSSAIGTMCSGATDCPSGYTCQPMVGIVLTHSCQILCTRDCDCPGGGRCVTVADKSHSWQECTVAP